MERCRAMEILGYGDMKMLIWRWIYGEIWRYRDIEISSISSYGYGDGYGYGDIEMDREMDR